MLIANEWHGRKDLREGIGKRVDDVKNGLDNV